MPPPLITIITPSLNRAGMIREAVESVLVQDYQPFEHIIVDGASTDATLDILRGYPHLRVISEPDAGMYDAINKGLRLASGEIIGLLNTDDWYPTGAFETVANTFAQNQRIAAIVGSAQIYALGNETASAIRQIPEIQSQGFWYRVIEGHPVTNAWFFRTEVFSRVGAMDPSYRFAADREFLIRAAIAGVRPLPISKPLYCYRQHPGSATISPEDSREVKRGAQRLQVIGESMRLLEGFLDRQGLPAEARYYLRSAHGAACYRATATALYHHRFRTAFHAIRLGFRYDLFWPAIFIARAWHRALQELGIRAAE